MLEVGDEVLRVHIMMLIHANDCLARNVAIMRRSVQLKYAHPRIYIFIFWAYSSAILLFST